MTWFRLDDQGAFHAKVIAVGNEAYGAWCRAGQWSSDHLTNGRIPTAIAHLIASRRVWRKLVQTIPTGHTVGLVVEVDGEYEIHDYLVYNPSADDVRASRQARSEAKQAAGRKGGQAKAAKASAKQTPSRGGSSGLAEGVAEPWQNVAPIPVPSRIPIPERSEIPLTPIGVREPIVEPEKPVRSERVVEVGTARCQAACETFVSALADRGWSRGEVRAPWERQALCDAINANLRADATAAGMLAELRRAVDEWARAHEGRQRYTSGWSPRKFADWLAEGREGAPAASEATARVAPSPAEPAAFYPPPTPEEAAALEQALRDMVDPAKRTGVNVVPLRAIGEDMSPDDLAKLEAKRRETVARMKAELAASTPAVAS